MADNVVETGNENVNTVKQEEPKKDNYAFKEANAREEKYANIPDEYIPIGVWGYFGYNILFRIPVIGLVLMLVFSFGGTSNINLKNYARSQFCILIIIFAVLGVFCLMVGVAYVFKLVPNLDISFNFPR